MQNHAHVAVAIEYSDAVLGVKGERLKRQYGKYDRQMACFGHNPESVRRVQFTALEVEIGKPAETSLSARL
jgi:hypothetical protein